MPNTTVSKKESQVLNPRQWAFQYRTEETGKSHDLFARKG